MLYAHASNMYKFTYVPVAGGSSPAAIYRSRFVYLLACEASSGRRVGAPVDPLQPCGGASPACCTSAIQSSAKVRASPGRSSSFVVIPLSSRQQRTAFSLSSSQPPIGGPQTL